MTRKRLGRGLASIYGDDVVEEYENDRRAAAEAAKEKEAAAKTDEEAAGSNAGTGRKKAAATGTSIRKKRTAASKSQTAKKPEADEKGREVMVRISRVVPKEGQPRQNFDEEGLAELAESIRQHGVIQPLIVQKKGEYYEIISGERRWRAAKLADLKELPVLIRDYDDRESAEISLIENVQREDLNPIEEALAYRRLMDEFGLKQDEIAERVSKDRSTITNSLRLLRLAPDVQQMVSEGVLSAGHARALLGVRSAARQTALAKTVAAKQLSVRETEAAVKRLAREGEKKKADKDAREDAADLAYENMAELLTSIVSSKVSIKRKNKDKGKIEIEYASQEELERIVELMETIRP